MRAATPFFLKSFNCDKLGCENDCEGRNDEREMQGTYHFLLSFMRLGSGWRADSLISSIRASMPILAEWTSSRLVKLSLSDPEEDKAGLASRKSRSWLPSEMGGWGRRGGEGDSCKTRILCPTLQRKRRKNCSVHQPAASPSSFSKSRLGKSTIPLEVVEELDDDEENCPLDWNLSMRRICAKKLYTVDAKIPMVLVVPVNCAL